MVFARAGRLVPFFGAGPGRRQAFCGLHPSVFCPGLRRPRLWPSGPFPVLFFLARLAPRSPFQPNSLAKFLRAFCPCRTPKSAAKEPFLLYYFEVSLTTAARSLRATDARQKFCESPALVDHPNSTRPFFSFFCFGAIARHSSRAQNSRFTRVIRRS